MSTQAARLEIPLVQRIKSQIRYNVPLEFIRTPFGEPFNSDNHWVKTLAEYNDGVTDFRESSLYRFHKNFQPNTILDIVSPKGCSLPRGPLLGSYPWGKWTSREGEFQWKKSCHCGPSADELIEKEWSGFISLYEKIKLENFNFRKYGHPLGLFFINDSRQKFFIVLGGNHRAAIAQFLGLKTMRVRLLPRKYISNQVVRRKDISYDPLSKLIFDNVISTRFIDWEDEKGA